MTKRMMSYLRGAGQILDLSGSYLDEVIIELRKSNVLRSNDARILRDDMNVIGEDLAHALNNIDTGLINARRRGQGYVD